MGIILQINKQELWFLCMTLRLNVHNKCVNFHQHIFNRYQVVERTRFCDGKTDERTDALIIGFLLGTNNVRKSCQESVSTQQIPVLYGKKLILSFVLPLYANEVYSVNAFYKLLNTPSKIFRPNGVHRFLPPTASTLYVGPVHDLNRG